MPEEQISQRGNKFRIYPTKEQELLFAKNFKNSNFVYNWGLGLRMKGLLVAKILNSKFNNTEELQDFIKKEIFFLLNKKNRAKCLPEKVEGNEKYKHLMIDAVNSLEWRCERTQFLCLLWNVPTNELEQFILNWCKTNALNPQFSEKHQKWFSWEHKDVSKKLTQLKKGAFEFLKETNAQILNEALRNVNTAMSNWFQKKSKAPRFKKKYAKKSFSIQNDLSKLADKTGVVSRKIKRKGKKAKPTEEGKKKAKPKNLPQNRIVDKVGGNPDYKMLIIPSCSPIKINLHRTITTHIQTVTITQETTGFYYASFNSEKLIIPPKREITKNTIVGMDYGLTTWITKDDGTQIQTPRKHKYDEKIKKCSILLDELTKTTDYKTNKQYKKIKVRKARLESKATSFEEFDEKIKYYSRILAKLRNTSIDWKTSKRYEKIKQRKARLEARIAQRRNDFQHKQSNEILDRNISAVGIEDLSVKNMLNNKRLSKSISRAAWSQMTEKLQYKSELRGITLVKVDRFFASSKICSKCGHKNEKMTLDTRVWTCNNCKTEHQRDENAAINIKGEAAKILGV